MNNANRSQVSLKITFGKCHILFSYLHSFVNMYTCTGIIALGTSIAQQACNDVHVIDRQITTNLADVNWTVTVINQRRLPSMSLMIACITAPVHRRGRELQPPWRMNINFWRYCF